MINQKSKKIYIINFLLKVNKFNEWISANQKLNFIELNNCNKLKKNRKRGK